MIIIALKFSQVNTNGIISLNRPFLNYQSEQLPLPEDAFIAPFWDDVDVRTGGQILYRYSDDDTLLRHIGDIIDNAFLSDHECCFNPELLFIATWDRVSAHSAFVRPLIYIK